MFERTSVARTLLKLIKTMTSIEQFRDHVYRHFSILETKYGYQKDVVLDYSTMYYVSFRKRELAISVNYSKKNVYIDVRFINNFSSLESLYIRDHANTNDLSSIMFFKDHNLDYKYYDRYMPSVIDLDDSLEQLAKWMVQYTEEYITSEEWHSSYELNDKNKLDQLKNEQTDSEIKIFFNGRWTSSPSGSD